MSIIEEAFSNLDAEPTTEDTPADVQSAAAELDATDAPDAQTEGEEGKPAKEPAPLPPEEALFTEEALSTKEGVAAARDFLRARQKEQDQTLGKRVRVVEKREAKLREKVKTFAQERDAVALVSREMRESVAALQRGDAKAVLETLGRLTGRPPVEMYKAISMHIATNGKAGNTETDELRRKIESLEKQREEEAARARQHEEQVFIRQRQAEMLTVAKDVEQYPTLANYVAVRPNEVAAELTEIIVRAHAQGRPVSDAEAARILNEELERLAGPAPAAARTAAPPPAKATTGRAPGKSLPVSLSTQSSAQRALSEEERLEQLAQDEDFWRSLGGPFA